jgi:hypothetical protein
MLSVDARSSQLIIFCFFNVRISLSLSLFFLHSVPQKTLSWPFEVPHKEHRPFQLLRRIVVRDRIVLNCSCKLLILSDFQEISHISPVCADLFCADGENDEQSKNQMDKRGEVNIRFSQLIPECD